MKVLAVIFSIVLFASCGSNSGGVGSRTTMEVQDEFLAGEVIKGEMIAAKFKVTNTGDIPLIISEVSGSCTCTVADFPEDAIAPGESGEILAHVNTEKTGSGMINKSVRIVANTEPSVVMVWVRAKVKNN